MKKEIILFFVLILLTLVNAQYIIDIDVNITPKAISPGESIIVNTNIIKLDSGSEERIDVKLSYEIQNENGKIIETRSSTLALQTSLSISEVFTLPNNIKSGDYKVIVKVDYQDYSALASDLFYVKKTGLFNKLEEYINKYPRIIITILMLVFLIIVIILLLLLHRRKDRYINKVDIEDILKYRRGKL